MENCDFYFIDIIVERTGKALKSEVEVLNELPRDASDRTLKLVTMLYESAAAFFKTHKLQMDALEDGSFARSLVEGKLDNCNV